jgi:penicillin amidase
MRIQSPNQVKIPSKISFSGLSNPVNVYYDKLGIPHINAQSSKDLLMVEGYLMARDRLWGMDFYRRQAKGQLAEIFSFIQSDIIETDYSLRALGFYRIALEHYNSLSNEAKQYFSAFTEGINQFIQDYKHRLPIEFGILGYTPDLWDPVDSLAILKLMAFGLTAHGGGEPLIGIALRDMDNQSLLLDFVRMALNNPNITWLEPIAYPKTDNNNEIISQTENSFNQLYKSIFSLSGASVGSNNWVIHGSKQ